MKRGRSVLGSVLDQQNRSLLQDRMQERDYTNTIQTLRRSPQRLQQFITSYRTASTRQSQQQIYGDFRRQQMLFKRCRQQLTQQFNSLQNQPSADVQQLNYLKSELVQSIKQQMNLDLEMNQLIDQRRLQMDQQRLRWENLQGRTPLVQNALQDIMQKTAQILQLQASIKQCLNLLQIIGVLVKQQGDKISKVEEQVAEANFFIEQTEAQLDIVRKRMEQANRRKCCVIIVGLVAICLILVVLYGVSIIKL